VYFGIQGLGMHGYQILIWALAKLLYSSDILYYSADTLCMLLAARINETSLGLSLISWIMWVSLM